MLLDKWTPGCAQDFRSKRLLGCNVVHVYLTPGSCLIFFRRLNSSWSIEQEDFCLTVCVSVARMNASCEYCTYNQGPDSGFVSLEGACRFTRAFFSLQQLLNLGRLKQGAELPGTPGQLLHLVLAYGRQVCICAYMPTLVNQKGPGSFGPIGPDSIGPAVRQCRAAVARWQ